MKADAESPGAKLLVIAGPTGAGKSEAAVKVAEKIGGEIINADSIQVYRHFNIGSAKVSRELQKRAPHHLIDICEPDENFTMWDFKEAAQKLFTEISSRGNVPILCGGAGLYIKAAIENLDGGPTPDPELREELRGEMESEGPASMHERLVKIDPDAAAKTHPNDRRRILRALETALLPKKETESPPPAYRNIFFVLCGPREKLYEKINARVEKMLKAGWVEETKSILDKGFDDGLKPFQSLGYRQIALHLGGELGADELAETIKKETRNYAKRQITWFGSVKGSVWLDSVSSAEGTQEAAAFIARYFRNT